MINPLWLNRRYGVVLVDTPENGGAPEEPGPRVRYTTEADSSLYTRRVRVYDGKFAHLSNVLYDSGWLPGDYNIVDVPLGAIVDLDETYYVQVQAEFIDGRPGLSEMRAFTPGWEAVDDPAPSLTVLKIDMCNAPTTLPRVRIAWTAYEVSDAVLVLDHYLVMRQQDDGVWEHLISLDPGTEYYDDFEVNSHSIYRYAVLPVISHGTMTLVSNLPDIPAETRVEFDGLWLHQRDDPFGLNLRFDSWTPSERITQPIEMPTVWGRRAPVALVREQLFRAWTVSGPPAVYSKRDWIRLQEILDAQFHSSATFVARFGRQRTMSHVAVSNAGRQMSRSNFTPAIELTEVSVEERFG